MKTESLPFPTWINRVGIHVVARELKVTIKTVKNWRSGACYPRVWQMRKIKRLSGGQVGYEQIIERNY